MPSLVFNCNLAMWLCYILLAFPTPGPFDSPSKAYCEYIITVFTTRIDVCRLCGAFEAHSLPFLSFLPWRRGGAAEWGGGEGSMTPADGLISMPRRCPQIALGWRHHLWRVTELLTSLPFFHISSRTSIRPTGTLTRDAPHFARSLFVTSCRRPNPSSPGSLFKPIYKAIDKEDKW